MSDSYGWRPFFFIIGALLVVLFFILNKVHVDAKVNFSKPSKKEIVNVLKRRENLVLYLSMFLIFFIFQAVLNFIPFDLQKFDVYFHGTKTGLTRKCWC